MAVTFAEECAKNFGMGDITGPGAVVAVAVILGVVAFVWVLFRD